jgi:hypothetical protein
MYSKGLQMNQTYRIIAATIVLASFSSSALAQSNAQRSNYEFVSQHSVAYIPEDTFAVQLLDLPCPKGRANIALAERQGMVALSGCYTINKNGDVDVYWENGAKVNYGMESVRPTLLGRSRMSK